MPKKDVILYKVYCAKCGTENHLEWAKQKNCVSIGCEAMLYLDVDDNMDEEETVFCAIPEKNARSWPRA